MNKALFAFAFASCLSLTVAPAHAWFFFWLPGSVTGAISDKLTGSEGDHCVSATTAVGDRISLPGGGSAVVKSLSGTSVRCQDTSRPIRALLDLNASSMPAAAPPVAIASPRVRTQTEGYRCVSPQTRIGDDFADSTDRGLVKAITKNSTECGVFAPIQALVVFDPAPATKQEIEELAKASARVPETAPAATDPAPVQSTSASDRLRLLNKLLEDGLITQDDYNAKKREILSAL